jgi:hypothetical protein
MRRLGLAAHVGAWLLASWSLAAAESPGVGSDPLEAARDALESGNASAAAAGAEAFIAASPGDPRLADAQRLLGLARERAGLFGAAWDQYSLFLLNFPQHPARDEVAGRADSLVRRVAQRSLPPPGRWRVALPADGSVSQSDDVAVVLALAGSSLGGAVSKAVTRAAVDGARVWVWLPLGTPATAFDPFDDGQVTRLEEEFRTMASWPIEGFVVDGGLHVGEGSRSAAALRAHETIARVMPETSAGRERIAWTWAGMRARASAGALNRWVIAAEAVNPRVGWLVRVSTAAVERPELALRSFGEDLAELRRAAPRAVWAIDAPIEAGFQRSTRLSELGSRLPVAVWSPTGDIVALP